jgi:hypothetical protein
MNNDRYEMKWIHILHSTLSAGLSDDKWCKLNIEYDAAPGFKPFVICEIAVHWKPEVMFIFLSQNNEKLIIHPLPGRPGTPRSVMSLVTTHQVPNICQSHLSRTSGDTTISCCVGIQATGSQSCSNPTAFATIWSKFCCTVDSSVYVLSRTMTAPVHPICQFHLALRQSRQYWVLQLEYNTQPAYSWQSPSFSWRWIEV